MDDKQESNYYSCTLGPIPSDHKTMFHQSSFAGGKTDIAHSSADHKTGHSHSLLTELLVDNYSVFHVLVKMRLWQFNAWNYCM